MGTRFCNLSTTWCMMDVQMEVPPAIAVLVADSSAFIKGAPLEAWSGNVVTIREVVAEIRDAHTRQRLQVLPYDLSFREPSQEALHHVTCFAKRTGDYSSLSPVDLKLVALTYQLECEQGHDKGANLRTEPVRDGQEHVAGKPKVPGMVGFYSGAKPSNKHDRPVSDSSEKMVSDSDSDLLVESMGEDLARSDLVRDQEEIGETDVIGDRYSEQNEVEDHTDSDDEGWITPQNFQEVCREMGGALEECPEGVAVGCITTDFAMQNVMLQMGLTVISVEGMKIQQLRTYALQCKACLRTTLKTTEMFCPNCGHRTLIKVAVVVEGAGGSVHYQPLSQKQFSHRGLRHSLPLPKGGRHSDMPILAPDQRVTYKERRRRANKLDPLGPDYVANSSPFAMNDVTSRGANLAFAKGGRGGGGRRRNPNQVRPKGKRK